MSKLILIMLGCILLGGCAPKREVVVEPTTTIEVRQPEPKYIADPDVSKFKRLAYGMNNGEVIGVLQNNNNQCDIIIKNFRGLQGYTKAILQDLQVKNTQVIEN